MDRQNISSGAKWEDIVGYSRAVVIDNRVYVSGTTATDAEGNIVGINDPYIQTKQVLSNIENVLIRAGSKLEHVVRTRMFVTDISKWEEYGRAHGEVFKAIKPASTMVEVSRLVNPEMMIEIEVEAVKGLD